MTLAELKQLVSYVTNTEGQQISVLVPQAVWAEILQVLDRLESGLHPEDEKESNAQILADLAEAVRATKAGETFPVSQLWAKVYE
jgi:predicted nucleic acid-binding protein